MQISLNPKLGTNYSPRNFGSACTVKSVILNGEPVTEIHNLYRVANVLASDMFQHRKLLSRGAKALSPNLFAKILDIFPDFKMVNATSVAPTSKQGYRINIIAGHDANVYRNNFLTSESRADQSKNALHLVQECLGLPNNKCISITAEENAGIIKIIDVNLCE